MTFELACCALFLIAALFYIFYLPGDLYLGPKKTRASYLRERRDAVYENLRDLNFEFKAGKMPDVDYQSLKASLQEEAATLLAKSRASKPKLRSREKRDHDSNSHFAFFSDCHPEVDAFRPPKDLCNSPSHEQCLAHDWSGDRSGHSSAAHCTGFRATPDRHRHKFDHGQARRRR